MLVLALAPRFRHEFKRPGFYLLFGMFALCTVPPMAWNAQHAWVTLAHLRSRGGIEHGFGLHPVEVLSFIGEHFLAYSPFLFLALAWGVLGSWRRVNKQFKVLFLMWFGLPVFLFYLCLSLNKAAAPNWDALAFLGFGLLAIYYWRERTRDERPPAARRGHRDIRWADHEYDCARYGLAARGWIQVTAKRSKQPDARLEKRYTRAGDDAQ